MSLDPDDPLRRPDPAATPPPLRDPQLRTPPEPGRPGYAPRPAPSGGAVGLLLLCCLLLGITVSWAARESHARQDAQANIASLQNQAMLISGKQGDLGRLLSDPKTTFVRLAGSTPSHVRSAAVAWNEPRQAGALFCDQLVPLDPGLVYRLKASPDGQPGRVVAEIEPEAGRSVYPFHPAEPLNGVTSFELDTGPSGDARGGGNGAVTLLSGTVH